MIKKWNTSSIHVAKYKKKIEKMIEESKSKFNWVERVLKYEIECDFANLWKNRKLNKNILYKNIFSYLWAIEEFVGVHIKYRI